ncbi:MAG: hypothetical protein E7247_00295 [Paenibacillaceae bacterium]|nr:hypothetical protein [Paenibacillaceae bacterium]
MLNDLKNHRVQKVLIFCIDELLILRCTSAVNPQAEVERCIIHMLHNSFKYVFY